MHIFLTQAELELCRRHGLTPPRRWQDNGWFLVWAATILLGIFVVCAMAFPSSDDAEDRGWGAVAGTVWMMACVGFALWRDGREMDRFHAEADELLEQLTSMSRVERRHRLHLTCYDPAEKLLQESA